jgi:hypothetical protein
MHKAMTNDDSTSQMTCNSKCMKPGLDPDGRRFKPEGHECTGPITALRGRAAMASPHPTRGTHHSTRNSTNTNAPELPSRPIARLCAHRRLCPGLSQLHRVVRYATSAARARPVLARCAAVKETEGHQNTSGLVLGRRQLLSVTGGSAIWTVGCPRAANAAGVSK